jgi:hypothetical protein
VRAHALSCLLCTDCSVRTAVSHACTKRVLCCAVRVCVRACVRACAGACVCVCLCCSARVMEGQDHHHAAVEFCAAHGMTEPHQLDGLRELLKAKLDANDSYDVPSK